MDFPALPDTERLVVFIVSSLVLLITPGPAVLYIVARSLADGLKTGIASAIGMAAGGAAHVVLLVLGFATVLDGSPALRTAVQLLGSAFLVYLGVRRFTRPALPAPADALRNTQRTAFADAAIVNLLNPKAIIFLFAFLPQFAVASGARTLEAQLLGLGIVFLCVAVVTDVAYAIAASAVRRVVVSSPARMRAVQRFSGVVLMALGVLGAAQLLA